MVVAISLAYVAYGGLWWMQALFYTIGATVIAIIAIAAYKLARGTNKRNPLLWGIFVLPHGCNRMVAERSWQSSSFLPDSSSWFFRLSPGWKPGILMTLSAAVLGVAVWLLEAWLGQAGTGGETVATY